MQLGEFWTVWNVRHGGSSAMARNYVKETGKMRYHNARVDDCRLVSPIEFYFSLCNTHKTDHYIVYDFSVPWNCNWSRTRAAWFSRISISLPRNFKYSVSQVISHYHILSVYLISKWLLFLLRPVVKTRFQMRIKLQLCYKYVASIISLV